LSKASMRLIALYAILGPIFVIAVSLITNHLIANLPYSNSVAKYWSQAPYAIGFDHGLKGLYALFFGVVPYWLWRWTGKRDSPLAHIGLGAGILSGLVLGMSLDLQGMAVAFAARGYASDPHMAAVYTVIGNWAMTDGGLSVSLYVVADLFMALWLVSAGTLLRGAGHRWLGWTGTAIAVGLAVSSVQDWASLVLFGADTIGHLLQQNMEFFGQVWAAVVAIRWLTVERAVRPAVAQLP
jgi:hypothetical protein